MKTEAQSSLYQALKQRRSVRSYMKNREIPDELLREIFNLASLAPSSWNLQHWKYIIVRNQKQKEKLVSIARGQKQVAECSVVVAVLGDKEADKNAENIYQSAVHAGFMSEDVKKEFLNKIQTAYQTSNENNEIFEAIRNASLGAMQLMLAAKANGVDSCPMIGFDSGELIKELNIPDRYLPIMMITLGFKLLDPYPTTRLDLDEILVFETF